MIKRITWLMVSCAMVVALVLASCGPAEEEEGEVTPPPAEEEEVVPPEEEEEVEEVETVKVSAKKLDGTVVEKFVEKPRYGGTFTGIYTYVIVNFDETGGHVATSQTLHNTNEELMQGDWARGPAGTGETDWVHLFCPAPPPSIATGCLAESFELPDADTLVFNIRQGVHWHNKPPMNGRELVADDVVFSLKRHWEVPTSYHRNVYPWDYYLESITAPDKWTVVIECKPGKAGFVYEMAADHLKIQPREVIEMYGDMKDWRNSCGTGPFMLVDYVTDSSATFVRNPNYWMKDPLIPENQLPYLDGIKWLIITDISTQQSAMRTGKVDVFAGFSSGSGAVAWEDAESLMKTNPELKYKGYVGSSSVGALFMRIDKPELPFHDIKVRRALHMAIDLEEIKNEYYGGNADILSWPSGDLPELVDVFIPLEELPESIQELFEYNPDKARQLLAEAGYPNGFKTEILCTKPGTDFLSMITAYWAKIGVELELDVKDTAAAVSIGAKKAHNEMFYGGVSPAIPFKFTRLQAGGYWNYSMVNDPRIQEAFVAISAAYLTWSERARLMREVIPHILDQAYIIQMPAPYIYSFWQPWVKGYHGETMVGYMNNYDFPKFIWIDRDLKEQMTGQR